MRMFVHSRLFLSKTVPLLILFGEVQLCSVGEAVGRGIGAAGVGTHDAGPLDADGRIIPGDAAFIVGMVEVIALVTEFGDVGEDKKPVGEATGDEELFLVFFGEQLSVILTVSRGTGPQVHSDVKDFAFDDPHQLGLRIVDLEVQPAQHAFFAQALVVLHEVDVEPGLRHVPGGPGLHKISAAVAMHCRRNNTQPLNAIEVIFNMYLSHSFSYSGFMVFCGW